MANNKGLFYPFAIIQGETFSFSFEFNISGMEQYFDEYTFVGHVRDKDNALITIANMIFVESEEAANIIDVSIPATQTQTITEGTYNYEIKCTNIETNEVKTLFYGSFSAKNTMILNTNPFG